MKICIIQPYLTLYRVPVFEELSTQFDVTVLAGVSSNYISNKYLLKFNFNFIETVNHSFKYFSIQGKIISYIFNNKIDAVFAAADPRYVTTWIAILIAKLKGIKVILHGQGLYRKGKINFLTRLLYKIYYLLCDKYVCYTELSKDSLLYLPIYEKSVVCHNSIVNEFALKRNPLGSLGVLFVGRLREGTNIEFLIKLAETCPELTVHIVGGSHKLDFYKEISSHLDNIVFYGEIYDQNDITEISKKCSLACYPGDAGLSVLHYMSLSLPVVVHQDIKKHMGPEPSYVIDEYNGYLFERNNVESFVDTVIKCINLSDSDLTLLMKRAFETYIKLTEPSLGTRFSIVVHEVLGEKL